MVLNQHRLQDTHRFAMAPGFKGTPSYDEAKGHELDLIGAGDQWTMVKEHRHTKDIKDLKQLGKVA